MEKRAGAHIDFLDSFRGAAILSVFLFHVLDKAYGHNHLAWDGWHRAWPQDLTFAFLAPFTLGWAGVAIFFVVSGFCIHLSFSRKPDWKEFASRRFFRVYPPYLLALLVFAFWFPGSRLAFNSASDFLQLGTHLLLIHNLGNSTCFGINGAFWTIAVEAQLYFIYPLLLFMSRRLGWIKAIGLTALIEISLRTVSYFFLAKTVNGIVPVDIPKILSANPFFYWFSWSIGAFLAEQYLKQKPLPFTNLSIWGLAFASLAAELIKPLSVYSFTLFSLTTAALMAKLLEGKIKWRLTGLPIRFLEKTGLWSYSIYLLHQPVIIWMGELLNNHLPGPINRPIYAFIFLVVGWLIIMPVSGLWYRFAEIKGINLGKYLSRKTA